MTTAAAEPTMEQALLCLFQIEANEEMYWIAAYTLYEALGLFREVEPDDSEISELSIVLCPVRASAGAIWDTFQTHKAPGLVATTL